MAKNIHLDVFNRHFKSLEDGLQMELLYPTFVKKGLLEELQLQQIVQDTKKVNYERIRPFLDSIKKDLQADSDERFKSFLEALHEYGNNDSSSVVNKLANKLSKDLEAALKNEPQPGKIQDSADADLNVVDVKKEFEECETLFKAFIVLTTVARGLISKGDFNAIKESCLVHCHNPGGAKLPQNILKEIKECSDFNELFGIFSNTVYWNVFDIRILDGMATASRQEDAKTVISIFKEVVYPQKISKYLQKKLLDSPNKEQQDFPFYTKVKEHYNKDPESFTVGDVVKHRKYLEREKFGIEGFIAFLGFDWGSLIFHWLIPTTMVYYGYISAKHRQFLPDGIISLEIIGCGIITFTSENNVLSKELQQIEYPHTTKFDPTDTMDAYHKVLVHLMDAESVGHLMVSRELISKDDLDAITDAPSDFLKNSYLLEHVEQQLDSSGLHTFFSLLQESGVEVNKFIGDHFLRRAEDASASITEESESSNDDASSIADNSKSSVAASPINVGTKRKQPDHSDVDDDDDDDAKVIKHAKVSRSHSIQFAQLLQKLYKLLQSIEAKDIILVLTQLLATKSNKIQLFSQKELLECNKCANVSEVLKRLRHCWTWCDHTLLRVLIEACHIPEAVKLLNDYCSSFDASQPLSAYPFADVSSSLAVYDHSAYTLLVTKHEEDFSTLLLHNVDNLKLMLTERFEVTEHCVRLVAVNSNPTILCWMIPKCIVPTVSAKVQEHCSFLCAQNISEVAIYPNTIIVTDGSLRIGLLAYLSSKLTCAKDDSTLSVLSQIKELPELLSSLQTDLTKCREEANASQLMLEEYQITNKIEQEIKTKETEEMEVVKISAKMQGEVLSEKESQLMVMKKEMQNLQKLNKSLTRQYAELKCEKNALDTKVKNLENEVVKLNAHLQQLEKETLHLKAQESHQIAKQMEAELQKKDLDISSLTKNNEELVEKLTESQEEIDIMLKDIQENDRPTMQQLSLFVLSQSDVVREWNRLQSHLLERHDHYIFRNSDPIECCAIVLGDWLQSPNATWNSLLRTLERMNLRYAANRIADFLPGYKKKSPPTITIDFESFENIQQVFQNFTSTITSLLRVANIDTLRRACILQSSGPSGVKLPADVVNRIQRVGSIDHLINELTFSGFLIWIDTRFFEAMAAASSTATPEPLQLIKDYKRFVHKKKLSEILPNSPNISTKHQYVKKVSCKINIPVDELTIGELINFKKVLETIVLDINEGSLELDHITEGCIEMHCYISTHLFTHAYQSTIKNTDKFSSLHIRYVDFKDYPKIYSVQGNTQQIHGFSLPSTELSPTNVVQHYHQYLIENMDSDSVSHLMTSKKLLTKADVKIINGFFDNCSRNGLILKHVMLMNIAELFSFCEVLLDMEHQYYIGTLLINALKSTGVSKYSCYPSVPRPVSLKCYKKSRSVAAAAGVSLAICDEN